jgi:hypothetical protein
MKKQPIVTDPTLPTVKVMLDGKEYTLCLNQRALAEAEMAFIRAGHNVNLLSAYMQLNLSNLMVIFPCALHKYHPEISFIEAQEMVTTLNSFVLVQAVSVLWGDSHSEPDAEKNE